MYNAVQEVRQTEKKKKEPRIIPVSVKLSETEAKQLEDCVDTLEMSKRNVIARGIRYVHQLDVKKE
nr:MAG TPA: NikA, BACTERIAL CONJUGATION, RELAXASE, DNA [Caudoviricetes sp.]